MHITPDNKLKKLIVIGDRVLIRPARPDERTESGLYLAERDFDTGAGEGFIMEIFPDL